MNKLTLPLLVGTLSLALFGACSDDSVQPNPHFTAGTTSMSGAPAGGELGTGLGGAGETPSSGAPAGGVPGAAGNAEGGSGEVAQGGMGGDAPVEPPYDCVLHPKTHLEIINACTAATRIEKHPDLPAIP